MKTPLRFLKFVCRVPAYLLMLLALFYLNSAFASGTGDAKPFVSIASAAAKTGLPGLNSRSGRQLTAPSISVTGTLSSVSSTYGTASASTNISVSGANMTAGILVTPPAGFEVSTNNTAFSGTLTVGAAGTIASTKVYVRLAPANPAGTYSGNVGFSSQGAASVFAAMTSSTVAKAMLTITADNQTGSYGQAIPALTISYSGFTNGDNTASLTTSPTVSTTATSASPAGIYILNASGAVDPNYTFKYTAGTLTINKAPLTITADNQTMTQGQAIPALTATYSGFVNGDNTASLTTAATVSTPATSSSPAGSYPLTASGAIDPNYTISYVAGTLKINPAPPVLTIAANNQSTVYGSALPALTVTYAGFVNGDNAASLTTAPTVSTTATSASPAGTYPLNATGAVDPNYTFKYVAGTLTISKAPLTITADNQTMTHGQAIPALTATYSGFVNGDNTASLTTAATVSTPATSSSPIGSYPLTASGAVDPNYKITYVAGTLNIVGPPTVSYASPQSYTAGTAVSLSPTSTGVAAAAFASVPTLFYSGVTPYGVAVDGAGNVYMAVPFNSAVMKIPAGGGTAVSIGSGFLEPTGVAVDDRGDVYVADAGNNAVKVISAGGVATIGTGFSSPTGVSVDANGNVFVADFGNNAVKEILAGNGATVLLANGLDEPYMVATDGAGNIYATETGSNFVVEIPPGGGAAARIGSGYSSPAGIAVDGSGNVYVCNDQSSTVEIIPAGGGTPVILGSGFSGPIGLTIDASGDLYIGDSGNNAIKELKPVGGYYVSPLLPAGLLLNSSTGVISGMVTSNTSATDYTVTAYNTAGNTSAVVNIATSVLNISYASPQVFTAGTSVGTVLPTETNVAAIAYNNAALASTTSFNLPGQLAIDQSGNVYVAEANNNDIKKITPSGVVTVASGFSHPTGVAVDLSNNVYVADYGNNAIKEIPSAGGTVKTLLSGLTMPTELAVDGLGNIYFLQQGLPYVDELPAGGTTYVTVSGNFDKPDAIACDLWGNLYIADPGSTGIYKIAANGGPPHDLASVSDPTAVAVDVSGNIYYGDHSTNAIYLLNGTNPAILVSDAFSDPVGIAVDASGNVFGADAAGNSVQKITPAGGYFINNPLQAGLSFNSSNGAITGTPVAATLAINYTVMAYNAYGSNSALINIRSSLPPAPTVSYSTPKTFDINTAATPLAPTASGVIPLSYGSSTTTLGSGFLQPQAITADAAGNVYVAGYGNYGVFKIAAGGTTAVALASVGTPDGLAVDASGNIYVSSWDNNAIYKIPPAGGMSVAVITGLNGPTGLAFDAAGNLYEADYNGGVINEFLAGTTTKVVFASGLSHPNGLATDAAGNVYVADPGAVAIDKIPAGGGSITTILAGISAGIWDPYGIAVDGAGNIFIAQRTINIVQEIPAGTTTLVPVGSGFNYAYDVATDPFGNLFVADYGHNAVKQVKPLGGYFISHGLPAGLTFNNNTGVINGTPTALTAAANYTVTGYNPAGGAAATVNLAVVSPDATLSALKLVTATLSPAFASGTTSYTSTVSASTDNISVQATTSFTGATMVLNGDALPDNSVSDPIILNPGQNTITLTVTAEDGTTTKTYTIIVTRTQPNATLSALTLSAGTLTPVFASGTTGYTASVNNNIASVAVTPTASVSSSTITVNGTAVTSGAASAAIPLVVGANTITTVVTAQDGTTTQTYTVTVTRAASAVSTLSSLKPSKGALSPAFSSGTTSYTASVVNGVTSMTLTPTATNATATIKVDGAVVPSGSSSQSIALVVGANTIPVKVTAQDGTTSTIYTVVVTRAKSPNAYLANLTPSAGAISPAFSASKIAYTEDVVNGAATITITPITAVPTSTVKVNGTAVASGTASAPIALNVGANTITTVVTAQDGVTTKTYTITATRAPSANANLSAFKISKGTLTPAFATATTSYTASVVNGVTSLTVTPTTADATATIKVDGTTIASGAASGAIALAVGSNTITTIVTAQDGTTTKTYTLVVTRAASGADGYDPGISVTAPTETPTLAEDGILVHQAVSPNGDGINDFLQIDNIGQYPDNRLTIMNRNGQLVYETAGYDNSSKVFDGHSNKNGQMQLPGTYFYQLDYTVSGITRHKTGFIILKY